MNTIDTLIHADWVIPVEPDCTALPGHSVAVRDGRIVAILPRDRAQAEYEAKNTVDLPGQVLIPGLINAHTHIAMTLMRGIADDLPLMTWLTEHIWPAEQAHMSDAFVRDGTRLGVAEMLKSGTTCFNDMYFFPEVVAREAAAAGIRAVVGLIMVDFPTPWAADPAEYLRKGIALHDAWRGNALIRTAFAPHAPYTVSDDPLRKVLTYASELDIPIHMHVHETAGEIHQAVEATTQRPLQRLDDLGLLGPQMVAVHMTQLLDEEIERFAETGGHVVHCPQSNMKLASGACPVQKLLDHGIDVALGTDGAASNNNLNMWSEMRAAALLGKLVANSAAAVDAAAVLTMATLGGARALALDADIGSLTPGKAADIVAVDLGGVATQPVFDPLSTLIYAAGREHVTQVWINGRRVLRDGALTTIDADAALNQAQVWHQKLS
ncbi:MAG: TRZ/ATZ family hydrolase [Chromatiales bacterium]|nr:TRZ/ATZ family hydrolase [Chromatiales bacterium]